MNIHEYQAKALLSQYSGINVLRGSMVTTVDSAVIAAKEIAGGATVVLKAQVYAGGRGKAGGIRIAKNIDEVRIFSEQMFGMKLIGKQTGAEGKLVRKLYVEEVCQIEREFYFCIALDRANDNFVMILSLEGGVDIEEIAEHFPEKIIKISVCPTIGLCDFHIRDMIAFMEIKTELHKGFSSVVKGLYKVFIDKEAVQLEINPLIIDKSGEFVILDAKFDFDDNSLFRHRDILDMKDCDEISALELEASSYDLNYIKVDGNIGCMVNGAGLAMATMDIINIYGGNPANFLDVGGGATAEKVAAGFNIISKDPNIRAIFVNIFGGIMRCDTIARGIIDATRGLKQGLKRDIPVMIRLNGTNADLGREMINNSGLPIFFEEDLDTAVKKIVELANGQHE